MDTVPERKLNDKNEESAQTTDKLTIKKTVDQFSLLTKRLLAVSRGELHDQEEKWRNRS